jgi:hypothetical protein
MFRKWHVACQWIITYCRRGNIDFAIPSCWYFKTCETFYKKNFCIVPRWSLRSLALPFSVAWFWELGVWSYSFKLKVCFSEISSWVWRCSKGNGLLIFRVFDQCSVYSVICLESVMVLRKTATKQGKVKSALFSNQSLLRPDIQIICVDSSKDTNWIWMSFCFDECGILFYVHHVRLRTIFHCYSFSVSHLYANKFVWNKSFRTYCPITFRTLHCIKFVSII